MVSTEFKAFEFRHRISLREYLETYYNHQFVLSGNQLISKNNANLIIHLDGNHENCWEKKNIPLTKKNNFGVYLHHGDILTWEAIEHNCAITLAIPVVEKRRKRLKTHKTAHYKKLEQLFRMVVTRFKANILSSLPGKQYLKGRGIDPNKVIAPFSIGTPRQYSKFLNTFTNLKISQSELERLLLGIFITAPPVRGIYLPFEPSIIVPVYDEDNNFHGFHGKRINPKKKGEYFNTGFLTKTKKEILFGEHIQDLYQAIQKTGQTILTKGIFDLFACYQEGYHQTYATLDQGISIPQFDKLMTLPCSEIIVGFNSDKERKVISGLMVHNLNKMTLHFKPGTTDIDEDLVQGKSLKSIIKSVQTLMFDQKEVKRVAALKKRNYELEALTEEGYTFLVNRQLLETKINSFKGSHKQLKDFLVRQSKYINTLIPNNPNFIRIPQTFVNPSILDQFNAELRILLFLMTRKIGNNPVQIKKETIMKSLGVGDRTVTYHISKLEKLKYIIVDRVRGKNHKILLKVEPSLIKFDI